MSEKLFLKFSTEEGKVWSKKMGERHSVDFVLVAELPKMNGIFYASTIASEELDRRYGENHLDKIVAFAIEKENGTKQLRISKNDGEELSLSEQDFVLLFVAGAETSGKDFQDSLLIVNFPKRIGQGIFQKFFPKDREGAGLKLFWLLKDMV